MSVGFVMLVHRDFGRAAQVVRHLAAAGAPVAVHVDRRAKGPELARFRMAVDELDGVRVSQRYACEWGMWPIVEASRAAARELLDTFPEIGHVALLSGNCLPLRPISEMRAFLAARPATDFIESVAIEEVSWIRGGLEAERLSLYFPLSWKRHRRLFDALVTLQRRLGVRRSVPARLRLHMGSQWWCLSRATLQAMFTDPDLPAIDRFFRQSWIPDESYFQTLARKHSRRIESRSLTFSRFDCGGRPHVFYDDHVGQLAGAGHFFARKIWPGADRLYTEFLRPAARFSVQPSPGIRTTLEQADRIRRDGRTGLVMQGRFPADHEPQTARPYTVIQGLDAAFENFPDWLAARTGATVHGRLMHPTRIEYSGGTAPGGLSSSVALRDYDREGFMRNLLWARRDRHQTMIWMPGDGDVLWQWMARDPNARLSLVSGAWAIGLWRRPGEAGEKAHEAARLQRLELAQVKALHERGLRARLRIEPLSRLIARPMDTVRWVLESVTDAAPGLSDVPRMVRLDGFADFLSELSNAGYPIGVTGHFSHAPSRARMRPPN